MRRMTLSSAGAVVALALAGSAASAASAKTALIIEEKGASSPIPVGQQVNGYVDLWHGEVSCNIPGLVTVLGNSKPKDLLEGPAPARCENPALALKMEAKAAGLITIKFKPAVRFTREETGSEGPIQCLYEAKKVVLKQQVPNLALWSGHPALKLSKHATAKGCSSTETELIEAFLFREEVLETKLVG